MGTEHYAGRIFGAVGLESPDEKLKRLNTCNASILKSIRKLRHSINYLMNCIKHRFGKQHRGKVASKLFVVRPHTDNFDRSFVKHVTTFHRSGIYGVDKPMLNAHASRIKPT